MREIPAEWTPLRALAPVERRPGTIFLESGAPASASGGAWGAGPDDPGSEWTFLAFDPTRRLELRAGIDPGEALAVAWPEPVVLRGEVPLPFASGFAGAIGYDAKHYFERYPCRSARESALPDVMLGFYDVVWGWERRSGRGWVVATGLPEPDPEARRARARARLEAQWDAVARGRPAATALPAATGPAAARRIAESNFTRAGYHAAVARALEHVAAGDLYQVNLSQRVRVTPAPEPAALYRSLRDCSPVPFGAYLSLPGGGVACASPERFFRIRGDRIDTWPIKGTRPRGATPAEDDALAEALRASEKDRAENVMIVDLERNDLGRVCETGSVRVAALWDVARFANVHHLVSRVEGRLRPGTSPFAILRALFPGGSITGAPKIRAVEIIDALEPARRGLYTGSIGYWDVRGGCDWNIAIRTVIVERGMASFHVGGGIVADSTPSGEYEETLVKARGMLQALGARWEGT